MEERKNKQEELQTRREFFKKAAKGVLPVLGAIALANVPLLSHAMEEGKTLTSCTNCSKACGGSCSSGCSGGCRRSCKTSCTIGCNGKTTANPCGNCTTACYSGCYGGCRETCRASCLSSCNGQAYY